MSTIRLPSYDDVIRMAERGLAEGWSIRIVIHPSYGTTVTLYSPDGDECEPGGSDHDILDRINSLVLASQQPLEDDTDEEDDE